MFQPQHFNRYVLLIIIAGLLVATLVLGWMNLWRQETYQLTIGAGSKSGEAYQFAQAISELIHRHHPDIHIEVRETKGSKENMSLLSDGEISLATVQADIEAVPDARIVANLYPDLFQLVVSESSGISSFKDLKGKTIALPQQGGGQWISFWFVASHYGIDSTDIQEVQLESTEAVDAIIAGEVDALFRVRAAPNGDIAQIIRGTSCQIVPIDQGAAMQLRQPALEVSIIPKGAYLGNPAIPENDIHTVSVSRLLIAHQATADYPVRMITQVLFERRRELLQRTPLAGFVRQPNWSQGTFIPVHQGAQAFYEREKPHFIVENADFFALILSFMLMIISGIVGIRSYLQNKQKNKADEYTKSLLDLSEEVRMCKNPDRIDEIKQELHRMLSDVVDDLDKDRIHPEGFNFFSFTWNVAYEALKEQEKHIRDGKLSF